MVARSWSPLRRYFALFFLLVTTVASAAELPQPFLPVLARKPLHDVDTLHGVTLNDGWGRTWSNVTVRMADFDAPETDRSRKTVKVTDAEIALGIKARDELEALLKTGTLYVQPRGLLKDGSYNRLPGRWWLLVPGKPAKWIDIADWLHEKGYERSALK